MFAVETEQDILTCGDCQREFILGDIVKFVQHKVNRCNCNKEKCQSYDDHDFPDGEDNDDMSSAALTPTVISNKRPSISAPIALKGSSGAEVSSIRERLSPGLEENLEEGEVPRRDRSGSGESGVAGSYHHHPGLRGGRQSDAAVNTDTANDSKFSGKIGPISIPLLLMFSYFYSGECVSILICLF